ncbi:hypothetical protein LZ31DRAFT_590934 [Colletotrichum somersetense]|nr:hypothetical protein LZ31DRAFT_590934 [Colletotrichum somersetense]
MATTTKQPSARDEAVFQPGKAVSGQGTQQASSLEVCRHGSMPRLDKKVKILQNGFDDADSYDVGDLIQERRPPLDAQSRLEGWLRECRAMEDGAKGCKATYTLHIGIVQDCQTELYRLRNGLLIKTGRFELIPYRLAKLRRWTGQGDENIGVLDTSASPDRREAKSLGEVQPRNDDIQKGGNGAPRPLSLELVKEAMGTFEEVNQEEEEEEEEEYGMLNDDQSELSRRHTWSGETKQLRREEEQETHRLMLAMNHKWPVNMRRAKMQYKRAMERQEWERDEIVLVRHSWSL